jgi:hypothetical protein
MPRPRRVLELVAVALALFASIATSPRRWSVESPELAVAPSQLSEATPLGQRMFVVTVSPELVARELPLHLRLRGELLWDSSDPAASSVLHLEVDGAKWYEDDSGRFDVVVRPGAPVVIDRGGTIDLAGCPADQACRRTVVVRHRWEQPADVASLAWRASVSISDVQRNRRDHEPQHEGALQISEVE